MKIIIATRPQLCTASSRYAERWPDILTGFLAARCTGWGHEIEITDATTMPSISITGAGSAEVAHQTMEAYKKILNEARDVFLEIQRSGSRRSDADLPHSCTSTVFWREQDHGHPLQSKFFVSTFASE